MTTERTAQRQNAAQPKASLVSGVLQRKCACGQHTKGGGECVGCARKKHSLQRKIAIGAANDPLEQEADQVADRVLAAPAQNVVNRVPVRIQRVPDQQVGPVSAMPVSVERVLASSGAPLETGLRQDMEQRFDRDFSQVRVHLGEAAAQSAGEVNANAYTAGNNIVFGKGRFAPGTHEGRHLIAHELTHVLQQARATALIQRKPDQDSDPGMSRRDEIALSKRSPGEFEIGSNFPPVMSLFNFGINNHKLKKEHKESLKILGELFALMGSSKWQVFVVGHADSTGEPSVNDPLSAKRADEVRKYLSEVAKGNYFIRGEGENRPVTTNESVSGRTRNRRVDILFINPGIKIEIPEPRPDPKTVCQLFPSLCNEDEFCDRYPYLCGRGFCAKHPEWCLLPVLCLLFPPACACLAKPIICACGLRPALCACLANPLACLDRPEKEEEPEPKPKRACPIKVDLPSGVIEANKNETVGFAELWYPFEMKIDFSQDSSGCECACGEYTQLVRGYFEEDKTGKGPWKRKKHQLTKGIFLHESIFQEDGTVSDGAYGHRYLDDDTKKQPKSNNRYMNDRFLITREAGCQYRGKDKPFLESAKKWRARIRMYLEFAGGPADVCESPGQRLGQQSHWRSWIIHGEAQAKEPPARPQRPPKGEPGPDSPEITTPEETDLLKGKATIPSWYAGGIPSDATSGEYRMMVGFKVDGGTKFSHVMVRIVESHADSIAVVTINKMNINLNPGEGKTPVIVTPGSGERIKRSVLLKVEKSLGR